MLDLIPFALQIAALVLLFIGAEFAYKKEYSRHGWIMVATVAIHTTSILSHIIPSLVENSALLGQATDAGIVIWSHALLGTAAEVLGIASLAWWGLQGKRHASHPFQPSRKWRMRLTFAVWAIALILGIVLASLYV